MGTLSTKKDQGMRSYVKRYLVIVYVPYARAWTFENFDVEAEAVEFAKRFITEHETDANVYDQMEHKVVVWKDDEKENKEKSLYIDQEPRNDTSVAEMKTMPGMLTELLGPIRINDTERGKER